MSSKSPLDRKLSGKGLVRSVVLLLTVVAAEITRLSAVPAAAASGVSWERAGEVVALRGAELPLLERCPVHRVVAWGCSDRCNYILAQVDERDPQGRWVLDIGDGEARDESPGLFDPTDWLLVAASDLGNRSGDLPPKAQYEVEVSDPFQGSQFWAYVGCVAAGETDSPRFSPRVRGEPELDRVHMRHVVVGFRGVFPTWFSVEGGENLIDRLKVRAQAKFLGVIPVRRDESSIEGRVLGWRIGPLRVIRAQQQWVRLGWGIRTPTFHSYAYFYADFFDVPVVLRLRFPATYFFSDIRIRAYVDFRDLRGWQLLLPGRARPITIDGATTVEEANLVAEAPDWFALRGPNVTLVQFFGLSPSLRTVRRRFFYRDDGIVSEAPEGAAGEIPGVGYELVGWEHVDRGVHSLHAMGFVLPPASNPQRLMLAQRAPLRTVVRAR